MAVNLCTVSSFSATVDSGSTVSGPAYIKITPDAGYVITPDMFTIPGSTSSGTNTWDTSGSSSVTSGITQVKFLNKDDANALSAGLCVDGEVGVQITFNSFTMSAANSGSRNIDIEFVSGRAPLVDDGKGSLTDRFVAFVHEYDNPSSNVTVTVSSPNVTLESGPTTVGGVATSVYSKQLSYVVEEGNFVWNDVEVLHVDYEAATNYYISVLQHGCIEDQGVYGTTGCAQEVLQLNTDGTIKKIRFKINYSPNQEFQESEPQTAAAAIIDFIRPVIRTRILVREKVVDTKTVSGHERLFEEFTSAGGRADVDVFGTDGSVFNAFFQRSSDGYYYENATGNWVAAPKSFSYTVSGGSARAYAAIPYSATAETYKYWFTAASGTTLGAGVPSSAGTAVEFYQYPQVTITYNMNPGGGFTVLSGDRTKTDQANYVVPSSSPLQAVAVQFQIQDPGTGTLTVLNQNYLKQTTAEDTAGWDYIIEGIRITSDSSTPRTTTIDGIFRMYTFGNSNTDRDFDISDILTLT